MGVNTPGVNIFAGAPPLVHPASTGRVFYVGSVAVPGGVVGSDTAGAHGDSPQRPFATVDYAVGQCTAGRGDVIYVLPGYTETLSAAAAWDLDVSGISVIGLGAGRLRPTITVATAVGVDVDIDAANITIENIFFDLTALDAVTAFIDVNAADFTMKDCEMLMADADGQAVRGVVGATAADRMKILHNVFRSTTAGAASAINLVGTADDTEIAYNRIYGDFSVAAIENATGNVCTNLHIHHNYIQNDNNGNWAIELVSACTGVIEYNTCVTDAIATAVDWGACSAFQNYYWDDGDTDTAGTAIPTAQTTGGMDLVTIAERIGADADTDALAAALYGAAGIATFPSGAAAANGVSMAEALRYAQENIITGTGTALPSNTSLYGVLAGASGVTTYPASAAPANAVSMAEVLRAIYNAVSADSAADDVTVQAGLGKRVTKVGDVASAPDDLFTVTGKCLITCMVGEVTSVIATTSSIQLTTSTNSVVITASTDITTDAAGTLYLVTGDPDDTLNGDVSTVPNVDIAWSQTGFHAPFMINDDRIYQVVNGAGTGTIQWDLFYIPLEASATVASSA